MEEEDNTEIKVTSWQVTAAFCDNCFVSGPEEYGKTAAQYAARNALWANVNGKTLCRTCRGIE